MQSVSSNAVAQAVNGVYSAIRTKVNKLGTSTTWYLIIKPDNAESQLNIEISDQYGGLLQISGELYYDIACGGSYYSVKAKKLLKGNWSSDAGTGAEKINNVAIMGSQKAICITMGAYTIATIINKTMEKLTITTQNNAPTVTRTISLQT